MPDRTFEQKTLNDNEPSQNWDAERTIERLLSYRVAPSGALQFFYTNQEVPDDSDPVSKALNILIDKNAYVVLQLNPVQKWRWSSRLDAVTTKKDYTMIYGDLRYLRDGQFVERPATGLDWDCKTVRFCARNNEPYHHPDQFHGFSMNIDLIQDNGKVLPITIDPDIKNPPVDPGLDEYFAPSAKFLTAEVV